MKKAITLLLICSAINLNAQLIVSGSVASKNERLPYVNIYVKGTQNGTITNNNGEFALNNIQPFDTLRFSMIGYQTIDTVVRTLEKTINIQLVEAKIIIPEIEVTAKIAESIITKIDENLPNNYPTEPTAFSALFRKQVVENKNYLFLGNANIELLYPTYLFHSNGKNDNQERKVILKDIKLIKNNLKDMIFSISPSILIDFYPQYGFITSPQYFNYSFIESISYNDEIYFKIGFKTKDKYWKSLPVEGIITVEKSSYAIAEVEYKTDREPENKSGYNKEKKIYKGTIITNKYENHIFYKKQDDKWYFNYYKIIWDVDIKYKKYPEDDRNFILQVDLLAGENIEPDHIKGAVININKDLFNKEKIDKPSNWEKLNPIVPDF